MADEASIDCVRDPDGAVLLFRVAGTATRHTVDAIDRQTASLDARHTVHVDLHDATIPTVGVIRELERLADRLERSMVRVRMVGVDPDHPALDARP